ncbi:MAG: RidA family protein [Hyphomicrobiales bacterium]|nr:RidA family protein [Hyphomicrobiales bacterium]MCP4998699.1 RidA family protein [Hyphomicrobiales bacterium]
MVLSINPEDVPQHKNPIPAAALHRGILVSSAISGLDPGTYSYSEDKAEQVKLAFKHLHSILDASGGGAQDIVKMDLYFRDKSDRALVNPHWLAMFPDDAARPARQAHRADLPEGCCLQIRIFAVMADG